MNINRVVGRMLTLKHFLDRPTWAAAAGYDFNYLDCMAFTADKYDAVFSALADVCYELPSTEVRDLPLMLVVLIAALAGIVVWPFIFWIVAFPVWIRCRKHREKYHLGTGMNGTASANLAGWLEECDRKWKVKK